MAKPVSKGTRDDLIRTIEKTFGPGSIAKASEAIALRIKRIPMGIFRLDLAMGGGIPRGRIIQFYGPESSGKTSLAMIGVAAIQGFCRWCLNPRPCGCGGEEPSCALWLDSEGAYDPEWAAALGVDNDLNYVIRTETAEEAIDVADVALRSENFDMLVVDSIAHMTPSTEIEESTTKWQVGLQARLVNKMMRKMVSAVNASGLTNPRKPTVILTNQIRHKIGVMFGSPEVRPGGMGQNFATSIYIRLSAGKYWWPNPKEGGQEFIQKAPHEGARPVKVDMRYNVKKSRVAVPRASGEFPFWLRKHDGRGPGDTEEAEAVWTYAVRYGKVTKDDGTWRCGDFEAGTKGNLKKALLLDPTALGALRDTLMVELLS